jgi:parallel beta-helix repeat protein
VLVAAGLLLCGAAQADTPILITQSDLDKGTYTISAPGKYMFAGNLSSLGSPAIQINSDNVDLNGAGYTLKGLIGYGIVVSSVSGVRIQNVNVTGFSTGIWVESGSQIVLIGNTASGNGIIGIQVDGSSNTLIGNTADGNRFVGIELDSGTENLVRSNSASSNGFVGITVAVSATGNRIQGNTARSNGIDLVDYNGNCTANTWLGNAFGTASLPCLR